MSCCTRERGAARIEDAGRAWSFDADGRLFRLASEASDQARAPIRPVPGPPPSNLDPLPHQIRAVYGEISRGSRCGSCSPMTPGPANDHGGLLIKELIVRGDVKRCLIVPPGSLVERGRTSWPRNLGSSSRSSRATRSRRPAAVTRFARESLVLARLDQLSRNPDVQAKLEQTDWI